VIQAHYSSQTPARAKKKVWDALLSNMCVYIYMKYIHISGRGHVTNSKTRAWFFINTLDSKEEGLECFTWQYMCIYSWQYMCIYSWHTYMYRLGVCQRSRDKHIIIHKHTQKQRRRSGMLELAIYVCINSWHTYMYRVGARTPLGDCEPFRMASQGHVQTLTLTHTRKVQVVM